jgi:hypothetical protein
MRVPENGNAPAATEALTEAGTTSRDTDTVAPEGDGRQPKSPYLTVEDMGQRYHASS